MFTGCEIGIIDLVILVDTSGSIRDKNVYPADNFQLMLNFIINDIVQLFSIGVQETLVGMIGFSNDAYLNTLQYNGIH